MSIKLTLTKKRAVKTEIETLLANLRDEIELELVSARHVYGEHPAVEVHDQGEEVAAELETGVNLTHAARHLEEIRACQDALSRLEQGTYGLCIDCGEAIELNRLTASPVAPRCLSCQAIWEKSR